MSTKEVFEHHTEAFGDLDMEEIMADYDEDSIVVTNFGTYKGLNEIQSMFEDFFEEYDSPDVDFAVHDQVIEGDIAFFTWEADTLKHTYKFGTDTFIIQDGIIRYQTVAVDAIEK